MVKEELESQIGQNILGRWTQILYFSVLVKCIHLKESLLILWRVKLKENRMSVSGFFIGLLLLMVLLCRPWDFTSLSIQCRVLVNNILEKDEESWCSSIWLQNASLRWLWVLWACTQINTHIDRHYVKVWMSDLFWNSRYFQLLWKPLYWTPHHSG